jgi:hypothetical protein
MPTIYAASIVEPFIAWVLDDDGDPIDLSAATAITVSLLDAKTRSVVLDPAGAATGSSGTGDGEDDDDDPNLEVAWAAGFSDIARARRLIFRMVATIAGKALVREWPVTIR